MISLKIKALVLAREKFKESDGIVYILTKNHGMLKCYVKGLFKINSKNLAFLQEGNFNNLFILTDLNKFQIVSALPIKIFKSQNYRHTYLLLWSLKIIKNLNLLETPSFIWFVINHLKNYLQQNYKEFPYWFLFHLYQELGYGLELDKCLSCQRKIKKFAFFDNKKSLYCLYCRKDNFSKIEQIDLERAKEIKNFIKIPSLIPPFLKKMIQINKNVLKNNSMIKSNQSNER